MTSPGPLGEEAAKLVEAVQEWLRGAAGGSVAGAAGAATGAAEKVASAASYVSSHIANGSAECQLCPVCQLLAALRGSRPEVFEHLQAASGSFLQAMRAAIEAHEHTWAATRRSPVERIDIG